MSTVFRLTGADFSGRGLPNVFPFVAKADMEYGFDFRNRASRMVDMTGKHIITPKRVDQVGGILNVTDPTIITTSADALGINVELGYLQLNLPFAAIPVNGTKQFTMMVVGGWSGIAFPPAKVSGGTATTTNLLDYGSHVGPTGFAIDVSGVGAQSTLNSRIENGNGNLFAPASSPSSQKNVVFLTFDGTNWRMSCKTRGEAYAGTNTSLLVEGNPIPVSVTGYSGGMVSLGGHLHQTTTIFGATPTIYQQAMWNRVLTDAEVEAQYQLTKLNFAAVGV